MTPVSRDELIRRLRRLGFEGPFTGGSHQFMLGRRRKLIIPNPHQGVIGIGLLSRILRQASVTPIEWDNV
jgi:predicted RNA binding protein YcfA (HicA-like mRNA interferase family)